MTTVTRINEGECEWAVQDQYGYDMPHGIRARRLVAGAGEPWDGPFCIRHAADAVKNAEKERAEWKAEPW